MNERPGIKEQAPWLVLLGDVNEKLIEVGRALSGAGEISSFRRSCDVRRYHNRFEETDVAEFQAYLEITANSGEDYCHVCEIGFRITSKWTLRISIEKIEKFGGDTVLEIFSGEFAEFNQLRDDAQRLIADLGQPLRKVLARAARGTTEVN